MGVLVLFQSNTHTVITSRCLDTQVQLILVHDLLIRAIPGHHLAKDTQVEHHHQDKTLRLWDLSTGKTTRRFEDHTKDVLSVAFSADNRQIVSASRDKTIKLWNTLAQCKYTIQEDGHQDWVSTVRFSPNNANPIIVSAGWDKYVKVWNLTNCKLVIAVMDKVPAGSESVLETITCMKMILIRKTLLLPRSCSMNNMTPGPTPMTSVFLNLRAQLISAALSLTKSCSHLTGRNTLLEPPALSLDGEPPLRVAALPRS